MYPFIIHIGFPVKFLIEVLDVWLQLEPLAVLLFGLVLLCLQGSLCLLELLLKGLLVTRKLQREKGGEEAGGERRDDEGREGSGKEQSQTSVDITCTHNENVRCTCICNILPTRTCISLTSVDLKQYVPTTRTYCHKWNKLVHYNFNLDITNTYVIHVQV